MARKLGLEHADIVTAAVAVVDEGGIESLGLGTVASRLGIRPPSLYHHVAGLKGLKREVALHAAAELRECLVTAASTHAGREALYAGARAYRDFARRHPGLLEATFPAPRPGEDDELYEALASVVKIFLEMLAEVGVVGDEAIHSIRTLRSYLHGFIDLESNGGFGMPYSLEQSFENGLGIVIEGLLGRGT